MINKNFIVGINKEFKIFAVFLALTVFSSGCASVNRNLHNDFISMEQGYNYSPGFWYRIVESVVKGSRIKNFFTGSPENVIKRAQDINSSFPPRPPAKFYRNFIVTETVIGDRSSFIITPKKNIQTDKAVFFLHGGGLMINMTSVHWDVVERIVKELSIPVCVPMYPVYPEINPDTIVSFVDKAFVEFYETYPDAYITGLGDSAGAYLLLSYCHYLTDSNAPRFPDKLICISPCQTVGISEDILAEMKAQDELDIIISIDVLVNLPYLYNVDADDLNYFNAPLYGDFSLFPPINVFIGTNEVFYPLIPPFVELVRSQGKTITLYTGHKMMHVWPYMPVARESKHALNIILELIRDFS